MMTPPDFPIRQPWREPEPPPLPSPVGIVPNVNGQWRCMSCGKIRQSHDRECVCDDADDTPIFVESTGDAR